MSENKHISIPKNIETEDQTDFHFLRKTGIEYIEKLGGKLWTDYNSHDPGITTLEVLSYAITDLGMRMNMNMEDILTSEDEEKDIHTQFLKATEILPSRPLTELDYRKLFIDINMISGHKRPIRNCWLVPVTETLYVDCETGNLDFEPIGKKTEDFKVKGMYDLYVDYAEDIDTGDIGCGDSSVKAMILERYHANRSLCEDLAEIKQVETQKVAVCARIGLVNKADEELVHAKVTRAVNNYLSPEVHFYSLKQMLDRGLATDQIFEGPLLDNGFIDTEELKNSQLRREVRLSDIISEIMKIDGIKEIHEISIAGCDSVVKQNNDWLICIEKGRKPELCELSSFSYSKGSLPLNINDQKVQNYLETLKREEEILREDAKQNKELTLPQGTSYDIANYATILNEFPDTYGVGISGIIGNKNPEREALAKQLKGYLLFFDQILAGYFKHLEKVKEVLSVNGDLKRTYFTQALKNIKGFDELVSDYPANDDQLTDSLYEELDNSVERRNEVLDHLISRFAETFSDYTFLMKSLYGNSADEIVLSNKESFLNEYTSLSKDRGLGYNYTLFSNTDIWNTSNISGAQKRIARLLGLKDYTQRSLSQSPVSIIETKDNAGKSTYTWKVKDKDGNIILSSVNAYKIEYNANKNLNDAIYQTIQIDQEDLKNALEQLKEDDENLAETIKDLKECEKNFCLIGNIKIRVSLNDNFYLEIVDDPVKQNVIATHKKTNPYSNLKELKDGILLLVDYLKYGFTEEGIFLVEHLLLKPTVKDYKAMGGIGCMSIGETFRIAYDIEVDSPVPNPVKPSEALMSSCEDCEIDVYDPYSFRVSVVLPGFAYRFQDPDFRRYAETVIRQEIPSHVLAKICWVGDRMSETETAQEDLEKFEVAFKKYLSDKAKNNTASLGTSISELVLALTYLNNIYRPGRLLDCAAEEDDDNSDGKIILGQSNLSKKLKK